MQRLIALSLVATATLLSSIACTSQSFCSKRAQCLEEEQDIELEDDSTSVCVAEFDGQLNTLRANEEDDCQQLANAIEALRACQTGLDCDDFLDEADLGGKCDDERDDLNDAIDDVSGSECTPQD